jgi:hypothetical protein
MLIILTFHSSSVIPLSRARDLTSLIGCALNIFCSSIKIPGDSGDV